MARPPLRLSSSASRSTLPTLTEPALSAGQWQRDVGRAGAAIAGCHRGQPADTQRVPGGADGGRRSPRRPGPTAGAPPGSRLRCWESRSRSRTTSTSRACRRCSARRAGCGRRRPTPRSCAGCAPRARSSSARPTPASWVSGRSPAGPHSGTPETRGRATTLRAARRAAARRRWPPDWSPRRSGPTARAACGSPRRGRTWSASSRSGAASRRGRCRRRSTASPSTGCSPAPSPTRRWCSTRRRATSTATGTSRRRSRPPRPSVGRRAR